MRRLLPAVLLAFVLASCGADRTAAPSAAAPPVTTLASAPAPAPAPAAAAPATVAAAVAAVPSEGPTRSFAMGETLPTVSLQVASDRCGVIRGQFSGGPPHGLQWSVTDAEGFEVLGRNALGETHYRYYSPGAYAVVLKAWGGESYVPVSNPVSISC